MKLPRLIQILQMMTVAVVQCYQISAMAGSAIHAVTNRQESFESESTVPLWKEAYYSLVMVEKMIHKFNHLCFEKDLEDIWEAICEMLLHPHSWLRNVSVRLIALYFKRVKDANKENHQSPLNEAGSSLMTENIVFSILRFHSLMGKTVCIDPPAFWSTLEQHEKNRFLKSLTLINARKRARMFESSSSLNSSVCEDNNQLTGRSTQYRLVSLFLRAMGKFALETDVIQMEIVFDSFEKIMEHIQIISKDDCPNYARVVLLPLYKVSEGCAGKVVSDNLIKLAEDTRGKIEHILGTEKFVEVYQRIRKNLSDKRNKRKQEEKRMAVIDPMQNAKRKLEISAKHRANKKRKIATFKMGQY
ncbi:hypothetical protein TSUD_385750 [Trifolium subterraneum]|uniref:U3 small nucleolar RNA-associated protein 20 C-terminal domain-containing protein n=1 Tax=Trifolium subterraneum TaxID=3900 RepID=A0A2Z6N389_TRISU|nr:hypothetical protein TSUD_385750 [Trifolium subterraneum]